MKRRKPPTDRELRVLAAQLRYGSYGASRRLNLAQSTVKNHLTNLYDKLGAESQSDAALRLGWLELPPELDPEADHPSVHYGEVPPSVKRIADATVGYVVAVVEEELRTGRLMACECRPRDIISRVR